MNLENLAGSSINTASGIIDRNYQPTNLRVGNYGGIYDGYTPVGRISSSGQVLAGSYNTNTGVSVSDRGNFCKTW